MISQNAGNTHPESWVDSKASPNSNSIDMTQNHEKEKVSKTGAEGNFRQTESIAPHFPYFPSSFPIIVDSHRVIGELSRRDEPLNGFLNRPRGLQLLYEKTLQSR